MHIASIKDKVKFGIISNTLRYPFMVNLKAVTQYLILVYLSCKLSRQWVP